MQGTSFNGLVVQIQWVGNVQDDVYLTTDFSVPNHFLKCVNASELHGVHVKDIELPSPDLKAIHPPTFQLLTINYPNQALD